MGSCTGPTWPRKLIHFVHYVYPLLTILYFVLAGLVGVSALRGLSPANDGRSSKPWYIFWFTLGVVATYIGETLLVLTQESGLPSGRVTRDLIIYTVSASLVWAIQALSFVISQPAVWYSYYGCWAIALVVELFLAIFEDKTCPPVKPSEYTQLEIQLIRIGTLCILLALFFSTRTSTREGAQTDEETQPLVADNPPARSGAEENESPGIARDQPTVYGTGDLACPPSGTTENAPGHKEAAWKSLLLKAKGYIKAPQNSKRRPKWRPTVQDMLELFSLVWPTGHIWLQLRYLGIGLCVLAGRFLKLLVLYQLGKIIDTLSIPSLRFPWLELSLYGLYRWLDSSAGLGAVKKALWVPLERVAYGEINKAAFAHLMSLSSDSYEHSRSRNGFDPAKSGNAVIRLVDVGAFEFIPTSIDIVVFIGFLWVLFDKSVALTVALVTVTYLWMTSTLYEVDKARRDAVSKTAGRESKLIRQVIKAWQTVVIYNRASYEQQRHSDAVDAHTQALYDSHISYCVLLAIQSAITCIGLVAASFLAANEVRRGHKPVGNFVILLAYWIGLSGTLYSISLNWRCIKDDLLGAKRLLRLFRTKPTIKLVDRDQPLRWDVGEIRFDDISFGYGYQSKYMLIENISFEIKPGQKVALAGGPGKSTILKLLFRLYDPTFGTIEIDGQDTREVTVESLREHMGIITNDFELFDDSILYNIRYGRLDATDQEVFDACVIAGLHKKILTFSDGYNTRVGKDGLSLSENELRKLSLARVLLKDPKVILVDEPESWGDDEVEIKRKVEQLTRGRSTLIAARQRSTMKDADLLLVIRDGKINQRGPHSQLIREKGTYRTLCRIENRKASLDDNQLRHLNSETEPVVDPKKPQRVKDTPLQIQKSDLVDKPAVVIEETRNHIVVVDNVSITEHKAATVLEDIKGKAAVAHDVIHVDEKPAAAPSSDQKKSAVAPDLSRVVDNSAMTFGDGRITVSAAPRSVSLPAEKVTPILEVMQGKSAVAPEASHANDNPAETLGNDHPKISAIPDVSVPVVKVTPAPEETQGKVAVPQDLSHVNEKPVATLGNSHRELATVPGLRYANDTAAVVLEESRVATALAHELANGKAVAVLGKTHIKNAFTAEPGQTKAKDTVANAKNSFKDKLEKDTSSVQERGVKGITQWKPDAPVFIPRNVHVLVPRHEFMARGYSQAHEILAQKDHKRESGSASSVKKDRTRQSLSDITNGYVRAVNVIRTIAASSQSAVNNGPAIFIQPAEVDRRTAPSDSKREASEVTVIKPKTKEAEPTPVKSAVDSGSVSAIQSAEVGRKVGPSDGKKETGEVVVAQPRNKEQEATPVNREVHTVETKNDRSQQNQSDPGKGRDKAIVINDGDKAIVINDDDQLSGQPNTEQATRCSENKEIQTSPSQTDLTQAQVDGNKEAVDSEVKKTRRRNRNRTYGSKRGQKSTSEESASQVQVVTQTEVETTKDSSKVESSSAPEPAKASRSSMWIRSFTNPTFCLQSADTTEPATSSSPEKGKDAAKLKKVRFRRGPQSQSEPSKSSTSDGMQPLRSSLRVVQSHTLSEQQDRRGSASSDIPHSTDTPSQSSPGAVPSSGKRQRFKNWRWKKQHGSKKSDSEATGSTGGGDGPKEAARTEAKAVAEKPVVSLETSASKVVGADKQKLTSSRGSN
ncbi:MAG: hypothetical protein M1816_001545 [Peltula sp. TS41687]|nr:MAG: hypothetical protein M1816_001545 [Peltula sp. TS41687]